MWHGKVEEQRVDIFGSVANRSVKRYTALCLGSMTETTVCLIVVLEAERETSSYRGRQTKEGNVAVTGGLERKGLEWLHYT